MNLNWKLILYVILFTLILDIFFKTLLPNDLFNVTALIGGIMAGYLIDGNYTDGMASGGISAGISGIIFVLFMSFRTLPLVTSMVDHATLYILTSLIIYFLYGVLGGLLGFAVRERRLIIQIMR